MRSSILLTLLSSIAGLAAAQLTLDNTTNLFTCHPGFGAYCAGTSIIVRCNGTVGVPSNCNVDLSQRPPVGLSSSPCVQTNATSGDAACSKDGILYPASGAYQPIAGHNLTHCNGSAPVAGSGGGAQPAWPMGNSSAVVVVVPGTTTAAGGSPMTQVVSVTGAARSGGVPSEPSTSTTTGAGAAAYTGAAAGGVQAGSGGVLAALLFALAL